MFRLEDVSEHATSSQTVSCMHALHSCESLQTSKLDTEHLGDIRAQRQLPTRRHGRDARWALCLFLYCARLSEVNLFGQAGKARMTKREKEREACDCILLSIPSASSLNMLQLHTSPSLLQPC